MILTTEAATSSSTRSATRQIVGTMSPTQDLLSNLSPSIRDRIPNDDVSTTALQLAYDALPAPILNHSIRVFLLARWLAEKEGDTAWTSADKLPLVFTAAVLHDVGAGDLYNGTQRFEVEGADAAKAHLHSKGISSADSHQVWVAIAIHTSAGIAERIDPLSRLIRIAVKMDFSRALAEEQGATAYAQSIEDHLPRLDVEKALGDAVVKQARKIPDKIDSLTWPSSEKHPSASWPGILLRAHLENPGHDGANPAF